MDFFEAKPTRNEKSYGGWDFSKKSRGVVACDGNGTGTVLWWVGGHLDLEVQEYGLKQLDELGLDDAPHGISIWEGVYIWHSGVNSEGIDEGGDTTSQGTFRPPTDEEWAAIREGRLPWLKENWLE